MKRELVVVACALLPAACTDDGGPRLHSVTPAAAGHGITVVLAGERLCLERPCSELGGEVQLGLDVPSYRATVEGASDTQWTFRVPPTVPAGATDVLISVGGRSSNALAFEVLP